MIGRMWRGEAIGAANADAYARHLSETVVPELRHLTGFRGAHLLREQADDRIEIRVLTLWDSRAAIEAFAGQDISVAVVEPEARAVLAAFDDFATHYEVTSFPSDEG
ncbi:antibiotic biosynthesis monooxygenase [Reyranella sp.]|uniref:antibiotic biosynthesis monooxygenase n=1 Tax=Reyranella sp. TaxID=1929291 RepID=UPI00378526F6